MMLINNYHSILLIPVSIIKSYSSRVLNQIIKPYSIIYIKFIIAPESLIRINTINIKRLNTIYLNKYYLLKIMVYIQCRN